MKNSLRRVTAVYLLVPFTIVFFLNLPGAAFAQDNPNFGVSPTFFAAKSTQEKCSAISAWTRSIIHEGRIALKNPRKFDQNYRSEDSEVMTRGLQYEFYDYNRAILLHFPEIFGKRIHQANEKEIKEIVKSLEKCAPEAWIKNVLLYPLARNPSVFSEFSKRLESEDIEAEQKARYIDSIPADVVAQDRHYIESYDEAVLLLNKEKYRLYGKYPEGRWCPKDNSQAYLVIVFKENEDFDVRNDDKYISRFENEILPEIRKHCQPPSMVVEHYIAGKYIIGDKVSDTPDPRGWKTEHLSYAYIASLDPATNRYKRFEWDREIYSLTGLRKEPELNRQRQLAYKAEEKARNEEKERQAALTRQKKADAKAPGQRIQIADLLALLKTAKVTDIKTPYDFSSYKSGSTINDIFTGNFLPFTDDKEPEDAEKAVMSMNSTDMFNFVSMRNPINMAYVAYNRAFEDSCRTNNDIPWKAVQLRRPGRVVRNGYGVEVSRIPEQVFDFEMRVPFANAFSSAYIAINNGDGLAQLMTGLSPAVYDQLKEDFTKFLTAEKCSSPAVRQMDVNIYLAYKWMLPLQILYQPAAAPVEKNIMPKQLPAKPAPRPRTPVRKKN